MYVYNLKIHISASPQNVGLSPMKSNGETGATVPTKLKAHAYNIAGTVAVVDTPVSHHLLILLMRSGRPKVDG